MIPKIGGINFFTISNDYCGKNDYIDFVLLLHHPLANHCSIIKYIHIYIYTFILN